MVAEWEPALGTLIRWPLGIPMELAVALARQDTLYTLVEPHQQQQAANAFSAAGIDLGLVVFINGNLWSMWTRDWGPQAIFDATGTMAYADPWFDGYPWVPGCEPGPPPVNNSARQGRGYEEDDALPAVVAAHLGVNLAPLPAYLTGGNIMTDGLGTGWSTQQMLEENAPYLSEAAFRQQAAQIMGLTDYRMVIAPEVYGIQHIDCYAKLLDERTVLVKQVPAWHPEVDCCEQLASEFAGSTNSLGQPYQVVRIFCDVYDGSAAAAYTNSLILNRKVFVPLFGIDADEPALETYRQAMSGYEVLGFPYGSWYDYDALHCRTMGIFDPGMLRLLHAPVAPEQPHSVPVTITAYLDDRSGSGLPASQQVVRWRTVGQSSWQTVPLTSAGADTFVADIPAQGAGSAVEYRLEATDGEGRQASLPRGVAPAAYSFTVMAVAPVPPLDQAALALTAVPNPFNPRVELRLSGLASGTCRVTIHDLRGRCVREFVVGSAPEQVTWDGTDQRGRAVPSGVYLATAQVGNRRTTTRLVLQR
jgi:agmatine/peptidylarginine deiminase